MEVEVQAQEERQTLTFVCTGTEEMKGHKPGTILQEVQTDGELGRQWTWDNKALKKTPMLFRPGAMYTIDGTIDDNGYLSVYFGTTTYIGMWEDTEQVAAWQVRSRAAEVAIRYHKDFAKETSVDEMLKVLEPLRAEYGKRNGTGRLALELVILEYLRYGRGK